MKYHVFTYPVPCDEAVPELNSFLSSHRILRVPTVFLAHRQRYNAGRKEDRRPGTFPCGTGPGRFSAGRKCWMDLSV
jgi:hypothetical protein